MGTEKKLKDIDVISIMEEAYPVIAEEFRNIQSEQYELFARKMMDYGLENITLGTSLSNPEDAHFSVMGIWIRMRDKISRLKNILKRKGEVFVEDESMVDTLKDISNYSVIAQIVLKGNWRS
jgi:hypothetical protein